MNITEINNGCEVKNRFTFMKWFEEALKAKVLEANAFTLATVNQESTKYYKYIQFSIKI